MRGLSNRIILFVCFLNVLSLLHVSTQITQITSTTTLTPSRKTTKTTGCVRPQSKTRVYGNALSTFSNIDLNFCCEVCQKVPDCYLFTWATSGPYYYSQVSTCNLFSNVSSMVYDQYSYTDSYFPKAIPFKCEIEENRLFYELSWTKVDNVYTKDTCIETCTFDTQCKSWIFMKDNNSSCLTSTKSFANTKWTNFKGVTTGACSLS